MNLGYELFDHTADIGIRVTAATVEGLVAPAAAGLYAVIGDLVPVGEPRPVAYDLSGHDRAELLRDWLAELLLLFDGDRRVIRDPVVEEFSAERLAVRAESLALDPARTRCEREVKAVTYHGLELIRTPGGWTATFIVDI